MAAKASSAPSTVAEGLGNVLRAISDTMQAPDATQHAQELMKLQATVLGQLHGKMGGAQQPGAPGGGAAGAQPPPGAGAPPPGGPGLGGGISGLMGGPQGPSKAVSGGGPSGSGMDPEEMRQSALVGADSGGDDGS